MGRPGAGQAAPSAEFDPQRWYTTNLVGVPAPLLARCGTPDEARDVFAHYMSLAFGLEGGNAREARDARDASEARRWRTSYLKLLQGWGLDSNGPAGAVLKGWVESRFGLVPAFHAGPLGRFPSPAWIAYLEQKSASRFHNNSIHQQLDLLYEFCQWMLARFALLGDGPWVTLWRGSTRCEEQLVAGSLRTRHCTVRLNNLVSFSTRESEAQCFGDWVLKARVPLAKLLLVPGLLNTTSLHGEAEVLALGGDYEVEARYD